MREKSVARAGTCRVATTVMVAGLMLLAGCSGGGGDASPTVAPDIATPTAPPATQVPLVMGAVAWATGLDANGAPTDEIDEFPRDGERIHAAVDVTGLSRGVSFEASWTINGMPVEGIGQTVVIDEPAPAGWVSFSLVWEGEVLWPVGTLGVTITASSGEATSGEIRIVSGQ